MILISVFAFSLIQNPIEPDDIRRALEFQYETKIKELEEKIESLESENEALSKRTKACLANNRSLQKNLIETQAQMQTSNKKQKAELESQFEAVMSPRTANEWYQSAQMQIGLNELDRAILSFEKVAREFPQSDLADNSIYWMAKIYLSKREPELARSELVRLLELYPNGDRAFMARQELAKLDKKDLSVQKDPHFADNRK